MGLSVGQSVSVKIEHKHIPIAIKNAITSGSVYAENKQQVLKELNEMISSYDLMGQFEVLETFDTAAGKFGIGKVNNYVYLDLTQSFHQIVNQTLTHYNKSL